MDDERSRGQLESAAVSSDFDASILISEPLAARQAVQRSVREIQERLTTMVQQHSRAQREQLDSRDKQDNGPSPTSADDQETEKR